MNEFIIIKLALDNAFKTKDLVKLKYFLDIEVAHSKNVILFYQWKYGVDILEDLGFIEFTHVSTLSDHVVKRHQDSATPYPDIPAYKRLVLDYHDLSRGG